MCLHGSPPSPWGLQAVTSSLLHEHAETIPYVCASSTHCVIEVSSLLSCHSVAYGIGFVAVVLVSFVSLIGVLLVPLVGKRGMTYVSAFLVAMGISALTSDAVLHLIPHVRLHMPYIWLWLCTVQLP